MKTHNPENERIKRAYFTYLTEAKGFSEGTLDGVAKALNRFETYTRFRDFKAFHIEQAKGFKTSIAEQTSVRTKDRLSKATLYATLSALKRFFIWLAGQPGYKSRFGGHICKSPEEYKAWSQNLDTRAARTGLKKGAALVIRRGRFLPPGRWPFREQITSTPVRGTSLSARGPSGAVICRKCRHCGISDESGRPGTLAGGALGNGHGNSHVRKAPATEVITEARKRNGNYRRFIYGTLAGSHSPRPVVARH